MNYVVSTREKWANFLASAIPACLAMAAAYGYLGWWAKTVSLPAAKTAVFAALAAAAVILLLLHIAMGGVTRAKVKAGAHRLDRCFNGDWATKINPRSLSIASNSRCMLGQLYGDASWGLDQLGLSWEQGQWHGFAVGYLPWKSLWLTPAWRSLILERRAA